MTPQEELAEQLHVLCLITGRTYIITRAQCVEIVKSQNSGTVKTISIGNCPITLHQIADMPTLDVYRRQMKTKLAMQHQRMCRRCGNVLAMQDVCSCKENGSPREMERAAKENPALKQFLIASGHEALALPEPKPVELPEAPPTPKERERMKIYQDHKNRFLGRTSIPSGPRDGCPDCHGKGSYTFQGTEIRCECTMRKSDVSRKPIQQAEQSGTLSPVPPSA